VELDDISLHAGLAITLKEDYILIKKND